MNIKYHIMLCYEQNIIIKYHNILHVTNLIQRLRAPGDHRLDVIYALWVDQLYKSKYTHCVLTYT